MSMAASVATINRYFALSVLRKSPRNSASDNCPNSRKYRCASAILPTNSRMRTLSIGFIPFHGGTALQLAQSLSIRPRCVPKNAPTRRHDGRAGEYLCLHYNERPTAHCCSHEHLREKEQVAPVQRPDQSR